MKLRQILKLGLYLGLCLTVVGFGSTAKALSQQDLDAINYDWVNWVPDDSAGLGCYAGDLDLTGNDNVTKIYNFLVNTHHLTSIQAIGIMANLQAESHFEPRLVEYGFPNSRGEMSVQGSPTSLDDAVPPDAPGNTHGQPGYGLAQWSGGRKANLRNVADQKNVKASDLALQLDFLWGELTSTYQDRVLTPLQSMTSLNDAVDLVVDKFEVPHDAASKHREREALGIALYAKLSGTSAPTGAITAAADTSNSSGCDIVASGNVVQTALNLAWPSTGHGKEMADAKPSYQVAMPRYNGATTDDPWSDCGVFVSTVMIASGADPTYPKRDTGAQLDYLQASSKYTEITSRNTADIQPGDIFVTDGHTFLYVGPQSGGYSTVAASLHDHVPQASGPVKFSDNYGPGGALRNYRVFRLK